MLDQRPAESAAGVVGVDADLLDVGCPVEEVEEQVGDGPVVGADRDERPAAGGIGCELLDRAGVVVGHEVHVERPEHLAGGLLDLDEYGQVLGAGGTDVCRGHAARPMLCRTSSSTIARRASASRRSRSAPRAVNASCAVGTGRAVSRTSAPIVFSTLRRSAWAQTAPKRPVLAPTTATGFPRRLLSGKGREAQSRAFLSAPGIEALYSGVAIRTASASASARLSRATDGAANRPSASASYAGRVSRPVHSRTRRLQAARPRPQRAVPG